MTEYPSGLRAAVAAAVGESMATDAAELDDHPSVDELIALHTGTLDPDEAEQVQDHLLVCRRCLENSLDLDAFVRAPEAEVAGSDDLATVSAWRAFLPRLKRRRQVAGRVWLAASLLLATLGLGWGLQQNARVQELTRPQSEARIVDLFSDSQVRAGTADRQPSHLPVSADYLLLVINLPEPPEVVVEYEIEISEFEGEVVWRGPVTMGEFGSLKLGLPGGSLDAGDYRLRLFAHGAGEPELLDTYALRLVE